MKTRYRIVHSKVRGIPFPGEDADDEAKSLYFTASVSPRSAWEWEIKRANQAITDWHKRRRRAEEALERMKTP